MSADLKISINLQPLEKLARKSPKAFNSAMKKGAIQFLTWANTGTGVSTKKPQIRWGVLRGSSSAFVGGELVETFEQPLKPGAPDKPTPNETHTAPPTVMTFGWNTDYAAKMHEWKGGKGSFTQQDGDAGPKWLEDHLKADRDLLMEVIGKEFKKDLGL